MLTIHEHHILHYGSDRQKQIYAEKYNCDWKKIYDLEDVLIYGIDDARFTQADNVFTWQTHYEDAGEYFFTVDVSDGDLTDEKSDRPGEDTSDTKERRRRFENLDPEQREEMRKRFQQMSPEEREKIRKERQGRGE